MSTKTIRLPPRRFLTPSKRKERDGFNNSVKPSITTTTEPPPPPPPPPIPSKLPKLTTAGADLDKPPTPPPEPDKSNQLLAGYLAHEFLSKGRLFGQPFDPATARAEIVAKKEVMCSQKAELEPSRGGGGERVEPRKDKCERYVDISGLLKREGVHIQGIVNPTQLARFLLM